MSQRAICEKKEIGLKMVRPTTHNAYFPPIENFVLNSTVKHVKSLRSKSFLQLKYASEGLSIDEIARQTFSSTRTIRKYLREFEIPLRPQDSKKGPPRFGYRHIRGNVIPCAREKKILDVILDLKRKGFSGEKISAVLNSLKIPTKTSRGLWQPAVVRLLLRLEEFKDKRNDHIRD